MFSCNALFTPFSHQGLTIIRASMAECRIRLFAGPIGYHKFDMGDPGILGAESLEEKNHPEDKVGFERLLGPAQALSRQQAAAVLVAHTFCWGGSCEQFDVRVFRNGDEVVRQQGEDVVCGAGGGYTRSLTIAAAEIGLALSDGYFPPLERDAFELLGRECT